MAPVIDARRPLSAVARHVIIPDGIAGSEWGSVRKTCRALGWDFDGWQDGLAQLALSTRVDGAYACDTIVISIPRQVGKTYLVGAILFAMCLMKPGLKVIWTAQVKDTALETFSTFFTMSQRPKLRPHVAKVWQGKGDEAIAFTNKSKIEFGSRDSGFGRGRTDIDVIVFDEGQHLSTEALENMGAAQNVAKNPLCFVMGTPPRPRDKGDYFRTLRGEAIAGESEGTLYVEMSADSDANPLDRDQWRKANPSFPFRTTERALLRLRKKLKSDDSWRREALGIWDVMESQFTAVNSSLWSDRVDVGPADDVKPDALGVDMSHGRSISVGACWSDGLSAHVEEVWSGLSEPEAIDWLVEAAGRRMPIVIDGQSPAARMVNALRKAGANVHLGTASDMVKACGLVDAGIESGRLTHADQIPVNEALEGSRRRLIGTAGGWGYDRRDVKTQIQSLVAITLARLGAEMARKTRRNPREQSVRG